MRRQDVRVLDLERLRSRDRLGLPDDPIERLHRPHGIVADRRLARQHDGVDAIVHGVGRVADFRARRPRFGPHRYEHLRRHDHREAERTGTPRHFLLHPRHAFERKLEAEIAARDHHRVARTEDLVEARHRLRPFEFGDERQMRGARLAKRLARVLKIALRLHEAERHEIDSCRHAEPQVVRVLRRQPNRRELHAWRVDALVLPQAAAVHHNGSQLAALHFIHAELNPPIVEQEHVAGTDRLRQLRAGGRDPSWSAWEVADGDGEAIALGQRQRLAALKRSGADLWSAEVLHDGDTAPGVTRGLADAPDDVAVGRMIAVRKIETEDIDARRNQLPNRVRAAGRRPNRGDDLGGAHEGYRVQGINLYPITFNDSEDMR